MDTRELRESVASAFDLYVNRRGREENLEPVLSACQRIARIHLDHVCRLRCGLSDECLLEEATEEEAYSAIARLFCPIGRGDETPISIAWSRFRANGGGDDRSAVLHLVNYIRTVVGQHRYEMFSGMRPQEFRIRRNLKLSIINNRAFEFMRSKEELYVIPSGKRPNPPDCILLSELRDHCFSVFDKDGTTAHMARQAMTCLPLLRPKYNCIRFNDLVRCVIEYRATIHATPNNSASRFPTPTDKYFERVLTRNTMRRILEKISVTYVKPGKIDRFTAQAYLGAMLIYCQDLFQFGSAGGLYGYLAHELPSLSQEQYETFHKHKLTYLATELRRILNDVAKRILGPVGRAVSLEPDRRRAHH